MTGSSAMPRAVHNSSHWSSSSTSAAGCTPRKPWTLSSSSRLLKELARVLDRIAVFYGREVRRSPRVSKTSLTRFRSSGAIGHGGLEGLARVLNIVVPMLSGNGVVFDEGDRRLAPGQDLCLPNIMRHC